MIVDKCVSVWDCFPIVFESFFFMSGYINKPEEVYFGLDIGLGYTF